MVFLITEMTHLAGMYTCSSLLTSPSFNPLGTLWSSLEQLLYCLLTHCYIYAVYARIVYQALLPEFTQVRPRVAFKCLLLLLRPKHRAQTSCISKWHAHKVSFLSTLAEYMTVNLSKVHSLNTMFLFFCWG